MGVEILVPLGFFIMIAVIVVGPRYIKSRERQRLLDTLRTAFDRGQPVPPDLMEALRYEGPRTPAPDRDLRSGIVLVSVALAFLTLGFVIYQFEGDEEAWIIAAIGAFPGFVGLGNLVFWLLRRNRPVDGPGV